MVSVVEQTRQEAFRLMVEHWQRVGPLLKQIDRQELRTFCHQEHADAIDSLLALALRHAQPRRSSGLVKQQQRFRELWG